MLVRLVQKPNAPAPMLATLPGIVTLVSLVQKSNAAAPMLVTLPGIVTLVTQEPKTANRPFPIPVTSRLLMLVGMVTALLDPMYPVMVMVFVLLAFML